MELNSLAFWSGVALGFRVIAIGFLIFVANLQRVELKVRTGLQPFKLRLFGASAVLIVSNIPICYLHYLRILGKSASEDVTSFATVCNALGMLLFGVLLYTIYQIKLQHEQ